MCDTYCIVNLSILRYFLKFIKPLAPSFRVRFDVRKSNGNNLGFHVISSSAKASATVPFPRRSVVFCLLMPAFVPPVVRAI